MGRAYLTISGETDKESERQFQKLTEQMTHFNNILDQTARSMDRLSHYEISIVTNRSEIQKTIDDVKKLKDAMVEAGNNRIIVVKTEESIEGGTSGVPILPIITYYGRNTSEGGSGKIIGMKIIIYEVLNRYIIKSDIKRSQKRNSSKDYCRNTHFVIL